MIYIYMYMCVCVYIHIQIYMDVQLRPCRGRGGGCRPEACAAGEPGGGADVAYDMYIYMHVHI